MNHRVDYTYSIQICELHDTGNDYKRITTRMLTAGLSGPSVFSRMASASLRSDAASLYLP